jgi:glycosyltransferase involved in cell wall biosynthesis
VEALDWQLPCIATRVGNAADIITPGINGLLVQRNDPSSLAEAMQQVVLDSGALEQLKNLARVPTVVPTVSHYVEQLAADYQACLAAS